MIAFIYSDAKLEETVRLVIKTLRKHLSSDFRLVYYTLGFKSNIKEKYVTTIEHPLNIAFPFFDFYKPELALRTINTFPNEYYVYMDTDIILSKRFHPKKVEHDLPYPKACIGPNQYPFAWWADDTRQIRYDETSLMKYFNVQERSQEYVWGAFYSFNSECYDFFEELLSMCKNEYLLKDWIKNFPFRDETPMNICLWKRNATENLKYGMVNTHKIDTIKFFETNDTADGFQPEAWEYVPNPADILVYHGIKHTDDLHKIIDFI